MAITAHTLKNGMTVLLEEHRTRPVISFNALVKVGSAFETDKEAGMCHVIEHMLFKGTPTHPVGEIARSIEAAGGEINAYTSFDQTVFYVNMASMFADKGLAVLVDAIQHPLFDAAELAREKEVILEEIRRGKDNPSQLISEELFTLTYAKHPYGRPIIGFPETVKSFTHNDLVEFYRRWYTPKNIVFIVVGDFESSQMLEKLQTHFAGFEGAQPPACPADELVEPEQNAVRLLIKTSNIQNVHLAMAWHIPSITHADIPPLDVASHILGGSDSSRLEQEVKEKARLVHSINAYAYTPKDPGVLNISALMGDEQVGDALKAILTEVHRLSSEPARATELSRAKLNIRSAEIYEKETVGGQAGKLAYFHATAGSHEFEKRYYQMLQDVHADDAHVASKTYLPNEKLTLVLLVPSESRWVGKEKEILDIIASTTPPAEKRPAKGMEKTPIHRVELENGMTLVVRENHSLPLVAICTTTLGGLRFEKASNNGVSMLMSRVMTKGTKTKSAVRIAKDIEKIAGHVVGFTGRNSMGLKCEFLSEHLRDGFALFGDVLTHPAWDAREIATERHVLLQAIRDQEDSLGTLALINFLKALFPHHPYGLRTLGTLKSVQSLKPGDLEKLFKKSFRPSQMILSVVGDVNPAEIEGLANEFLSDLPAGKAFQPNIKEDPRPEKPREVLDYKKEKEQAHIALGFQGTRVTNTDRYAFAVLNNILSGQGGRLFLTLRDQMGLAYVVSSVTHEGIEPGYFAVYMGTEPSKVETAIDGIKSELRKVVETPVTTDELDRAKQYIVGSYELESQRNENMASSYALNELYGLGIDEVENYPKKIMAVTREDVQNVAKTYLTLDAPVLSIIRPE